LTANRHINDLVLAADGSLALDCLYGRGVFESRNSGPPAIVLLDLKMPRVDGLEVLRQIKADARLKTIPTVVFTSSREEQDVLRCYQLGANAYVVKPVEFSQFLTVIERLCSFWITVNEPPPEDYRPDRHDHAQTAPLAVAA
jgi:CheY-like chemotaxis protein